MKRLSVILALTAASSMLLFGCGKNETKEKEVIDSSDIGLTTPETKPEEAPTEEEKPPTEEEAPAGKARSPITNEWVDEALVTQRPISVMTPNDTGALPHYGISNADVLYEITVEGKITRLMQIIGDWKEMERIGNVRSARHYFVFAAYEWDAIFCHYGNPYHADFVLEKEATQNINGMVAPSGVFYRTSDRPAPQNAYLSGEGVLQGAEYYKYPLEHTSNYKGAHYQFDPSGKSDLTSIKGSFDATNIDLAGAYPIDKPYFEYNAEEDVYYRFQYGKPHIDGANDEQLKFTNVIVQNTYFETLDEKGYLTFQMHDTTREGYLFTGGKGIPVTWEKTEDFGPTKYYDKDGKEVVLSTGKTMVCITQTGTEISYK